MPLLSNAIGLVNDLGALINEFALKKAGLKLRRVRPQTVFRKSGLNQARDPV